MGGILGGKQPHQVSCSSFTGDRPPPHQNEPSNNFPGEPEERLLGRILCKTVWISHVSICFSSDAYFTITRRKIKPLAWKFRNGLVLSLKQQTWTDKKASYYVAFFPSDCFETQWLLSTRQTEIIMHGISRNIDKEWLNFRGTFQDDGTVQRFPMYVHWLQFKTLSSHE